MLDEILKKFHIGRLLSVDGYDVGIVFEIAPTAGDVIAGGGVDHSFVVGLKVLQAEQFCDVARGFEPVSGKCDRAESVEFKELAIVVGDVAVVAEDDDVFRVQEADELGELVCLYFERLFSAAGHEEYSTGSAVGKQQNRLTVFILDDFGQRARHLIVGGDY
ncbi:hypothetical protein SDC9_184225 [bioreactor metagenome]|uniref:Uncharacterized protein n=1 Tax=bioreactor metagenome TaxID=1076179 RepID=A0A645HCF5_9ZZZZ